MRAAGFPWGDAFCGWFLGSAAWLGGDLTRANEYYNRALDIFQSLGDFTFIAWTLLPLANFALEANEPDQATALYDECLPMMRDLGDRHGAGAVFVGLGMAAQFRGEREEPQLVLIEAQTELREGGGGQGLSWPISNVLVDTRTHDLLVEATHRYQAGLNLPPVEWARMVFADAEAWRGRSKSYRRHRHGHIDRRRAACVHYRDADAERWRMAKAKTAFVCEECGADSPKWQGQCPECGAWNAMAKLSVAPSSANGAAKPLGETARIERLTEISPGGAERITLALGEVNRVLGGGIVPGSLTLVGGDPGIGKSTLLLQIADAISLEAKAVLYVSGEESTQQIKLRADRLGVSGPELYLLAETDLESILQHLDERRPALTIIDSIQTMYLGHIGSAAGSVAQVRECAMRLMRWAKARGVPVIIAGHVTKDGAIAGPRILEHMVDAVLYLEGEGFSTYRVLRGIKNRFGSTNEVGIFEMGEHGLTEVSNPSQAFLAHRQECSVGSAIVPAIEGTRPLLVEIQALATPTTSPIPRRTANGLDFNRFSLITAVLAKHLGVSLAGLDIIANVAGGLRVAEPAADLAVALATLSSVRDVALPARSAAIGEIGLSGELRPVPQTSRRLSEVVQMGFTECLLPTAALEGVSAPPGLRLAGVASLREAARAAGLTP